jgi:hypothetical protein
MAANPLPSTRAPRLIGDAAMLAKLGELGELQCTPAEVAAILETSEDAIARFFARCRRARAAYEGGKARGFANLRRAQFKLAQTNASMAIILGKAYLGQAERREAVDSGGFDVEAAGWRVRNKVAAVLDATPAAGGRDGD